MDVIIVPQASASVSMPLLRAAEKFPVKLKSLNLVNLKKEKRIEKNFSNLYDLSH